MQIIDVPGPATVCISSMILAVPRILFSKICYKLALSRETPAVRIMASIGPAIPAFRANLETEL